MANNFTPRTFRIGTITNLSYLSAAGAAVSTAGVSSQTYWISLTAPGALKSTGGARYLIGKSGTVTSTRALCFRSTGLRSSGSAPANSLQQSAMTAWRVHW